MLFYLCYWKLILLVKLIHPYQIITNAQTCFIASKTDFRSHRSSKAIAIEHSCQVRLLPSALWSLVILLLNLISLPSIDSAARVLRGLDRATVAPHNEVVLDDSLPRKSILIPSVPFTDLLYRDSPTQLMPLSIPMHGHMIDSLTHNIHNAHWRHTALLSCVTM